MESFSSSSSVQVNVDYLAFILPHEQNTETQREYTFIQDHAVTAINAIVTRYWPDPAQLSLTNFPPKWHGQLASPVNIQSHNRTQPSIQQQNSLDFSLVRILIPVEHFQQTLAATNKGNEDAILSEETVRWLQGKERFG